MPDADTAWNDDLLRDPHHVADKRSRVQRMFAAIATKYDLNNRLHSFWQDQRWRHKAAALAAPTSDDVVIDVACGTGDLTLKLFKLVDFALDKKHGAVDVDIAHVFGFDFTFEMLPIADRKHTHFDCWRPGPWFAQGDATALPLADASADVVSIAFGIRNVQEPHLALAEFFRVLRPGGRVIILEFSQPESRIIRFFNDLYCARIMPHTATWISGDRSGAYKYLPMSVATFMSREKMMAMMRDAGFVDVTQHPMTFGVAVVYRGYKR